MWGEILLSKTFFLNELWVPSFSSWKRLWPSIKIYLLYFYFILFSISLLHNKKSKEFPFFLNNPKKSSQQNLNKKSFPLISGIQSLTTTLQSTLFKTLGWVLWAWRSQDKPKILCILYRIFIFPSCWTLTFPDLGKICSKYVYLTFFGYLKFLVKRSLESCLEWTHKTVSD